MNAIPVLAKNGAPEPVARMHDDRVTVPPADIVETPEAFRVILEMPGLTRDAITVTVEAGTLTVRGEASPHHSPQASVLQREIRTGVHARTFAIGNDIDSARVEAAYDSGVLTVVLHKSEKVRPRTIAIT
jgi:HSP20 family protein